MPVKVLLIGDESVGKTCLTHCIIDRPFIHEYKPTIGVDFVQRKIEIEGSERTIQIWDVAGQSRYRAITNAFYRSARGVFLVFDMTNMESFNNLSNLWIPEADQVDKCVCKVLIGTKCDLESKERVDSVMARSFADAYNMPFFEVSAKDGTNVEEALQRMLEEIRKRGGIEEEKAAPILRHALK